MMSPSSSTLLADNACFSLVEDPFVDGRLYRFQLKANNAFASTDVAHLIDSLRLICEAKLRHNVVVFDTRNVTCAALQKSFFSDHFSALRGLGNSGLRKFVVVSDSVLVSFVTTVFRKLTGGKDIVSTAKTMDGALCIAHGS